MALTRITAQATEDLVLGGEVVTTDNAYKNYDQVTANSTITIAANKNYFLKGPITVANGITWTIAGGTLTVI